jgi:hypothetical protein
MVLIYIYKPSLTFDLFMKFNSKKKTIKNAKCCVHSYVNAAINNYTQ